MFPVENVAFLLLKGLFYIRFQVCFSPYPEHCFDVHWHAFCVVKTMCLRDGLFHMHLSVFFPWHDAAKVALVNASTLCGASYFFPENPFFKVGLHVKL